MHWQVAYQVEDWLVAEPVVSVLDHHCLLLPHLILKTSDLFPSKKLL